MQHKRLWVALTIVIAGSFAILGGVGYDALNKRPPIPGRVIVENGSVLVDRETIQSGQNVWQSLGGQQVGSIFGHGASVARDWTADWLHRESVLILDHWATETGARSFDSLPADQQAALKARLQKSLRTNTYDPAADTVTVDSDRAQAFEQLSSYYRDVFSGGRSEYAIPAGALTDTAKARQMSAFFWWTSWAASTNRPGQDVSYTQNWPHEPLVSNTPTGSAVVWSVISFVWLLAGIGGMVWYFASQTRDPHPQEIPTRDPLLGLNPTPSQQATVKYFFIVAALLVVQVGFGAVAAHYGVEGSGFYGFPLDRVLPYSIARTWHTQLGLFWIATSWLATGLYIAPAVRGFAPRGV